MRYVLLLVVVGAAFFGWKKYQGSAKPEQPRVSDDARTPAANAENRVNGLSGAAPMD